MCKTIPAPAAILAPTAMPGPRRVAARRATRVVLLTLALAAGAADALARGDAHAAMFRCNAAHDGVCATRGVHDTPNPAHRVLWRFRTGQLNRSTPVVADGTVYVGSNDGNLYALDAVTGALRWSFHTAGALDSSPAYAQGRVYFTGGDGDVYALEAARGRRLWTFHAGPTRAARDPRWDFYQSSPVVADGVVYVGSGDGHVYALDAANGTRRWAFETDGRVRASPALAGGVVYVGSMGGTLYALDARDGRARWTFKTVGNADFPLGEIQSSAAVADGMVYFGSRDGSLYALDALTGAKRWSLADRQGAWVISSPAVAGGIVYFGTSDSHLVRAVDAASGAPKWTFDARGRVFASPTVVGDRVYVGLCDTEAVWLDAHSGTLVGYADSEGTIYASIAVQDGVAYYASDDGYVYAVN